LLALRERLPVFARFHLAGHWDHDGRQMTDAIARVVAQVTGRTPRVTAFPWWLMAMAAPYSLLSHTADLGYVEEGWRSSLAACIYGGSTQVHLSVTAEKALGLPRSR